MTHPITIHEDDIISIVSRHENGIAIGTLEETILATFGRFTTYHTGSIAGLTLNDLLDRLDSHGRLHITRGVIRAAEPQRKAG